MRKHLKFLWVLGVLFVSACGTSDDDATGGGSSPFRLSSYASSNNESSAYTYNEKGQLIVEQGVDLYGGDYTYNFTYTEEGKLQRRELFGVDFDGDKEVPIHEVIDYLYNDVGQRTVAVESFLNDDDEWEGKSTSVYTYDDQGRLIQTTEDDVDLTKYGYNDAGQLAFVVDEYLDYEYDPDKEDYIASTAITKDAYTYNGLGQLASREDSDGDAFEYTYNEEGQLVQYIRFNKHDEDEAEVVATFTYEDASCTYLHDRYDPHQMVLENAMCRE